MSEQTAFYRFAESYFNLNRTGDASSTSTSAEETSTGDDFASPEGSGPAASSGLIAGAVVGSLAGCALLLGLAYLPYQTYRAQMRRAREVDALNNEKS